MRFELWVTDELFLKVFAVLSSGEGFVLFLLDPRQDLRSRPV